MILGIDASNIRVGGGINHLSKLLQTFDPVKYGFKKIVCWAPSSTLENIEDRSWLKKYSDPRMDKNIFYNVLWKSIALHKLVKKTKCDILFVPGGTFIINFKPVVTMSQNLLPFVWQEIFRYRELSVLIKLILLRILQTYSFRKANGTIFLTQYAKNLTCKVTGTLKGKTVVISHGIDERFFQHLSLQNSISKYNHENPFRLIYVSTIEPYKHQWHVAEAVAKLHSKGYPLLLDLIGSAKPVALKRLQKTMRKIDPAGTHIRYGGSVPHSQIHLFYSKADVAIFASSCETFGQILLEGMASGVPTACSQISSMVEIVGDAAIYFHPEDPVSIASAIEMLIGSSELREKKAHAAFQKAQQFSWERCTDETFRFLAEVAKEHM